MKTVPLIDRGHPLPSEYLRELICLRSADATDAATIDRLRSATSVPGTALTESAVQRSEIKDVAGDFGSRAAPYLHRGIHEQHLIMHWNSSHHAKKRESARWPLAAIFPRKSADSG